MDKDQSSTTGYSGESSTGSLVTEQVKQGTQQAMEQTQQAAGQVTETAKKTAVSYVDSQKQTATQSLRSVADALHETGTTLENKDQGQFAKYANQAADRVEGFAGYLDETPVQHLIRDVEDFARKRSTLFLGGALVLGLAAGRFIKASTPNSGESNTYGAGYYGSGKYGSSGYGYGQAQLTTGTSYGAGTPVGDVDYSGTPSAATSSSSTGLADEIELPDATVFNADLATEKTDGTAR